MHVYPLPCMHTESSASNTPAQILVLMGPLLQLCICSKATPKAAQSCQSGDPDIRRRQDAWGTLSPHQAAIGNTLGPRAEGNVWFFPPNKSTPILAHGNLALEQVCVMPGGGSPSPHICSLELRSLLLPNLQPAPWETSAVVYWKQLQPAVPKGSHGKLQVLFFNEILWVRVFYPAKALKVLLYYHRVLPAITEDMPDASMVLLAEFSLWEASQTCRHETTLQMEYSSITCEVWVLPPRLRLGLGHPSLCMAHQEWT